MLTWIPIERSCWYWTVALILVWRILNSCLVHNMAFLCTRQIITYKWVSERSPLKYHGVTSTSLFSSRSLRWKDNGYFNVKSGVQFWRGYQERQARFCNRKRRVGDHIQWLVVRGLFRSTILRLRSPSPAPVVQMADNSIQWKNLYTADKMYSNKFYPLDCDLFARQSYLLFEQLEPGV